MRNQVIITLISLLFVCFIVPPSIIARNYGEGNYGSGNYNVGQGITSSSSSGGSSSSGPTGCSRQAPDTIPDLFQINSKKGNLTLFFTPSSGNRDRYFVTYGLKTGEYQYGFEFNNSENGVISVDVGALQMNTSYYFKVRAGNGCQPGEWSNELSARTGQWYPTYRWSSFPQVLAANATRISNPSSISQIKGEASVIEKISPQQQVQAQNQAPEVKAQKFASGAQAPSASQPQPKQNNGGFWHWLTNLFK